MKTMNILLDPQIFIEQRYGGISRYYTEIFSRLSVQKIISVELPIYSSENEYFIESNLKKSKYKFQIYFFNVLKKLGISVRSRARKKNKKLLESAFLKQNFDLFIPTYYNDYFIEKIHKKPFVLTVYDMIHELFPEYFVNDPFFVSKNKLLLMEKATRIIAVSENTKKDILKIYPHINENKIDVVYHGNSILVNMNIKVELPENYILFVGSRPNYKNFYFLARSIKNLLINNSGLVLLCAGGGKFTTEEINFIKSLNLVNKIIQKNFKEDELGIFYKNAKCFVFPSAYEGFGIPVLESMACGCPIVLTNYSSFPEVAGNAGIYFELDNSNDLNDKIEELLKNETLRKKHIELGLQQVKKFDWNIATNQCLEVYNKAILNYNK